MNFSLESRLYFGADIPGGGIVSDAQFTEFLRLAVSDRFPGFTVETAIGSWRGETETVRILSIFHGRRDVDAIDAIADYYKAEFSQESVLVASRDVKARLW